MELSTIPMTSIRTGLLQEERSFEWKISNFPVVRKHSALIKAQQFDFYAGDIIGGMGSKWTAFLQTSERDGSTWGGIFIGLRKRPIAVGASEHLWVQFIFTFKTKDGVVKAELDTKVVDFYDAKIVKVPDNALGFTRLFDVNGDIPFFMELVDGCLVVHITFRIFSPSYKAIQPLTAKLGEFEVKSTAKTRAELRTIMGNPEVPTFVKVIANYGNEFWIQKEILSGRSPVFRAMLEADMTEGNRGVVKILDMGSGSLKTMLHFMRSGELIPEWKSTEALVELTNAAEKYELTDLLEFLDGVLGDACNLENVGVLIPLANRLGLKMAEADLLSFLRRNGANSSGNFIQVLNGVLTSESDVETSEFWAGPSIDWVEGGRRPSRSFVFGGNEGTDEDDKGQPRTNRVKNSSGVQTSRSKVGEGMYPNRSGNCCIL